MIPKEGIESKITQGEGLNIEFKTASEKLSRNVFETICAFLNRKGGYIFLGVKDNGKVEGIKEGFIPKILKTIADDINNAQILMPTAYISKAMCVCRYVILFSAK